eukprot:6192835-Pleurochrysis_carterae.AAC.2
MPEIAKSTYGAQIKRFSALSAKPSRQSIHQIKVCYDGTSEKRTLISFDCPSCCACNDVA